MNIKKLIIILATCLHMQLHPQIIVVRTNANNTIEALTDQDIETHGQQICDVLLNFTWPTCIAQAALHNLSDAEKDALLSAKIPDGEERFIRHKIKQISADLDVIAFPTTLYELFVFAVLKYTDNADLLSILDLKPIRISLTKILEKSEAEITLDIKRLQLPISPEQFVLSQIYDVYNAANNLFYKNPKNVLLFHQELAHFLTWTLNLSRSNLTQTNLNNHIHNIKTFLLAYLTGNAWYKSTNINNANRFSDKGVESLINDLKNEPTNNIIKKSMLADLEAQGQNKALLFRGSSPIKVERFLKSDHKEAPIAQEKTIIGSSIKHNNMDPYSLSFGNTILAGINLDRSACAYIYIYKYLGYILFINKKDYIEHYNANLFFIAPLATEYALLCAEGEWFHSRSKPVILKKTDIKVRISGLFSMYDHSSILDPFGIFLITRNPYKQAKLFSDFIVTNGLIIHLGSTSSLLSNEQTAIAELMTSQDEQKKEYKAIHAYKTQEAMFIKLKEQLTINLEKISTGKPLDQKEHTSISKTLALGLANGFSSTYSKALLLLQAMLDKNMIEKNIFIKKYIPLLQILIKKSNFSITKSLLVPIIQKTAANQFLTSSDVQNFTKNINSKLTSEESLEIAQMLNVITFATNDSVSTDQQFKQNCKQYAFKLAQNIIDSKHSVVTSNVLAQAMKAKNIMLQNFNLDSTTKMAYLMGYVQMKVWMIERNN